MNCVFPLVGSRDIAIHLPSETPPFFGLIIKPGEIGFSAHNQIFVRLGVEKAPTFWKGLNFDTGNGLEAGTIHSMLKGDYSLLLYLRDCKLDAIQDRVITAFDRIILRAGPFPD